METLIFSVLSLLMSGFAVYKVFTLEQKITQSGKNNKSTIQSAKGDGNIQTSNQ